MSVSMIGIDGEKAGSAQADEHLVAGHLIQTPEPGALADSHL